MGWTSQTVAVARLQDLITLLCHSSMSVFLQISNVICIADLVAKQVGFPVILLNGKCYPLSASVGTCGLDFWRSTRKILAPSKSLYSQVNGNDDGGTCTDTPPQA